MTTPPKTTPPSPLEAPPGRREAETLSDPHYKDCCCARAWKALGITESMGRSIPEEIERLKIAHEIDVARLKTMLERAVNAWVMTKERM